MTYVEMDAKEVVELAEACIERIDAELKDTIDRLVRAELLRMNKKRWWRSSKRKEATYEDAHKRVSRELDPFGFPETYWSELQAANTSKRPKQLLRAARNILERANTDAYRSGHNVVTTMHVSIEDIEALDVHNEKKKP